MRVIVKKYGVAKVYQNSLKLLLKVVCSMLPFLIPVFLNKHQICNCSSLVLESAELNNFDCTLLCAIMSSLADLLR